MFTIELTQQDNDFSEDLSKFSLEGFDIHMIGKGLGLMMFGDNCTTPWVVLDCELTAI